MRDLDDKNSLDQKLKNKLVALLCTPHLVSIGRRAERDMAVLPTESPLTKARLIDYLIKFINSGQTLRFERMDWGAEAFIFQYIIVEELDVYVKAQFADGTPLTLLIFSAHEKRRLM